MDALATERDDLGRSIELLPDVLRRANTTFVNLRSALGDLDPLVAAARPAARAATPLFAELRPFAADAVPTVRDLSQTIRRPGEANDLVELLRLQPAVDLIATRDARRNGEVRPGTFPVTERALRGLNTQLRTVRPFTPELVGWFDDFAHSGAYDALGGFSRAGLGLPPSPRRRRPPAGCCPCPSTCATTWPSARCARAATTAARRRRAARPRRVEPLRARPARQLRPKPAAAGRDRRAVNSPVTTTPAPAAPATPAAPGTRP
jgi:hypothetical protein